jgi:thiol-disulfide isomerase/thioredoxin
MLLRPALVLSVLLSSLALTASLVNYGVPAQANPCAGKVNPCAGKATVGGSLSPQLQGKPVVIDIYASWCPACKNIAPTLSQLRRKYQGKVNFVVFDVSDKSKATQSAMKAKKLGLSGFFSANKAKTGLVTIVDPASGKILAQHSNNSKTDDYTQVLDNQIAKK